MNYKGKYETVESAGTKEVSAVQGGCKKTLWEIRRALCFLGYVAAVSVLELLAYLQKGIFSVMAFRIWLLSGAVCLVQFFWEAGKQVVSDIKYRKVFLPVGFLLVLGIFAALIGNLSFSDISFEATQQAAEGLSSLKMPDGRYTQTGFLGYPNRQYILNALPAALFGRNILTLQLGFALPFLIGVTALFLELRAWLREKNWWEETALLPVASLLTLPYLAEYYRFYEQTLSPVAFGMLGVALLMRLYRKTDLWGVFAITWVGCMCCCLYTPALAFFGFLLVFLVLCGWEKLRGQKGVKTTEQEEAPPGETMEREEAPRVAATAKTKALEETVLLAAAVVCMCVFFLAGRIAGGNTDIGGIRKGVSLADVTWRAWIAFFFDLDGQFFGIHLGTVLLYIVLSLAGRLGLRNFLTAGWMLLTVSFARLFAGYTAYSQALENQRDMVILPVVVAAVFFAVWTKAAKLLADTKQGREESETVAARGQNRILAAALSVYLFAGCINLGREHHIFVYYRYVQPLKYAIEYTEGILSEEGLADTAEFNWVIYTDNKLQRNLRDYACFFYPNAHCYAPEPGEEPKGINKTLPTIILADPAGLAGISEPAVAKSRTWQNRRYSSEVTWYWYPQQE